MALQIVTTSKKWSLQLNDFWKGLIVATLTTPLTLIYTSFQAGTFKINWQLEGAMAAIGLIGYLLKNFGSGPQTVVTGTPTHGATTTVVIPPAELVKEGLAKPTVTETPKQSL